MMSRQTELEPMVFTAEEMDLLIRSGVKARELRIAAGMRVQSYQERRLEFAREVYRNNMWNTEKTWAWYARIKQELKAMTPKAPQKKAS